MTADAVRAALRRLVPVEPALLEGGAFSAVVADRRRACGDADDEAYARRIERDEHERTTLVAAIAVPETRLFRYPGSFELLREHLAERRAAPGAPATLRLLSAACATGEEPVSMALAALAAGWPADAVVIEALDIVPAHLAVARRGRWRAHDDESWPEWSRRWIRTEGREVVVAADALAMIRHRRADLLIDPEIAAQGPYDVVFCRNLLIYLDAEARTRLLDLLATWTRPRGLLFLGHAEPGRGSMPLFDPAAAPRAFAWRRREQAAPDAPRPRDRPAASAPAPRPAPPPRRPSAQAARPSAAPARAAAAPASADLLGEAQRLADAGRHAEALDVLGRQPAAERTAGAHELRGSLLLALDRPGEAREALRAATYLDPRRETALLALAAASERLGDAAGAARERRRAAALHRDEQRAGERGEASSR